MSFNSFSTFSYILDEWLKDEALYLKSAKTAGQYIADNTGATREILQLILHKDINKQG